MRGIRAKNSLAGKFLVEGPNEFVHVDVGVGGGRGDGERGTGDGALLVDDGFEARQVRRTGDADRAAFVGGDQALELDGHQAGEAIGLIAGDESADGFGRDVLLVRKSSFS